MEVFSRTYAAVKTGIATEAAAGEDRDSARSVVAGIRARHQTFSSPRGPSPHAPDAGLPLRFMLTGVGALLVSMGWVIARPDLLAGYHYNQTIIAVTHLMVLGFVGSVLIGAMYQLVPVALEVSLHSEKWGHRHYYIHLVGFVGMVVMFSVWNLRYVAVFGSVLALGVGVFLYNVGRTLARVPRWNVIAGGLAASLAWLGLTVLAGLYLTLSKLWAFSPLDPIAAMHGHAHLGVVGAFLVLIVAVSYKMLPMFVLSELQSKWRARWSLVLLNLGLMVGFPAILLQSFWKPLGVWLCLMGLMLFAAELRAVLRARKRRSLDWGVIYFLTALSLLGPAVVLALILSWPGMALTPLLGQLETVYGFVAIFAVVGMAILGMLYKIVPFLVWYQTYSVHIGRARVPALGDMMSSRKQAVGYGLLLVGILGLSVATAFGQEELIRLGALILASSLVLFVLNLGQIVSHRWRPRLGSLPVSPIIPAAPVRSTVATPL